jgi:hypothetical protein
LPIVSNHGFPAKFRPQCQHCLFCGSASAVDRGKVLVYDPHAGVSVVANRVAEQGPPNRSPAASVSLSSGTNRASGLTPHNRFDACSPAEPHKRRTDVDNTKQTRHRIDSIVDQDCHTCYRGRWWGDRPLIRNDQPVVECSSITRVGNKKVHFGSTVSRMCQTPSRRLKQRIPPRLTLVYPYSKNPYTLSIGTTRLYPRLVIDFSMTV